MGGVPGSLNGAGRKFIGGGKGLGRATARKCRRLGLLSSHAKKATRGEKKQTLKTTRGDNSHGEVDRRGNRDVEGPMSDNPMRKDRDMGTGQGRQGGGK